MTTLHKTVLVTSLTGLLAVGFFAVQQAAARREAAGALARQQALLTDESDRHRQVRQDLEEARRQLASERDANRRLRAGNSELLRLRGENGRLRAAVRTPAGREEPAMIAWFERVQRLRAWLEPRQEAQVPEMQLATEEDWLDATKTALDTDLDYRKAMSALRGAVEGKLVVHLYAALQKLLAANPGHIPATVEELAAHFDPPVDAVLLARWKVVAEDPEDARELGVHFRITQAPVDAEFDRQWSVGPSGYASGTIHLKNTPAAGQE